MFVANTNRLINIQRCMTSRCYQVNINNNLRKPNRCSPIKIHKKTATELANPKNNDLLMSEKSHYFAWQDKEEVAVLSFEEMPGPKFLKYLSITRTYLSEFGTQLTAALITLGLDLGSIFKENRPLKSLSSLFDEYGPVVRFVSPVGSDIVLTNHPEHIQKVFETEGEYPVRSALDCLEKYRLEHRSHSMGGLININGETWSRQRSIIDMPIQSAIDQHVAGVTNICDGFVQIVYNTRNHRDEMEKDLYKEIHKWAFDCMALILFSKRYTILQAETFHSQDDMTWLYHSLDEATEAIAKCESGIRLWRLINTPGWYSLVKHCDSLDNLIGKEVMEAEHSSQLIPEEVTTSLILAMLQADTKLSTEDVTTAIMDMLLVGVNTVSSSMSFLLYFIAKYGKAQSKLYQELRSSIVLNTNNIGDLKKETPYLQACIKETLRLVPPIPVLSRILTKNITLDKYNIPRGTLIIMSTQDSSLKEANFDDAQKFYPERWLNEDAQHYHAFASIPFGCGVRKCVGQNIAETMMSLLMIKILQKFKLEFHYGDIHPTRNFISKPNKPLRIRFVDRVQ